MLAQWEGLEVTDRPSGKGISIGVLGAGAVGGYFGGRLVQAGADVTFIVRDRRKAVLAEAGLRLESPVGGNFSAPVQTVASNEIDQPFDIVMLTCKAYDLDSAVEAIRPGIGERTAVLPLLNGIAHIDRLSTEFGPGRVLGGLAKIAATLSEDGVIRHLNDWQYLTFGELDGTMSSRVLQFAAAFEGTGVVATAVPDIQLKMWEKLVHLATIAGMTTLMRANLGEIARTPHGMPIMLRLLEANARIAGLEGFPMSSGFMTEYRAMFSDRTSGYNASMLRDIERKGPVEADHIVGHMLELAHKHGVEELLYQIIHTHLKAYEQRREAGRL